VRSRLTLTATLAVAVLTASVLAACGDSGGSSDLSGTIKIDGSSTVGPITNTASELFNEDNPDVKISVGTSGTGGGFEKFCAGETDMNDASRAIEPDEEDRCKKNNVTYDQSQVANDGIAVVVNPENDWAKCLTTAQLKKIWNKGSDVNNWNQVDSSFPDEPLKAFGPGTGSGTFDFFTAEINGEKGPSRKPWVKTSLAPGSTVVSEYYRAAGLDTFLDQLGFNLVGYGCTTCIGNSGPLPDEISLAVREADLTVAAVLSGNRNFEGRINPDVRANYLASPPLVVAYALAGTVDIDMETEPLGFGSDGHPVFLADIWPSSAEIEAAMRALYTCTHNVAEGAGAVALAGVGKHAQPGERVAVIIRGGNIDAGPFATVLTTQTAA